VDEQDAVKGSEGVAGYEPANGEAFRVTAEGGMPLYVEVKRVDGLRRWGTWVVAVAGAALCGKWAVVSGGAPPVHAWYGFGFAAGFLTKWLLVR